LYRRFDRWRIDIRFTLDVLSMWIIGRHDGLLRGLWQARIRACHFRWQRCEHGQLFEHQSSVDY